MKRYFVFMRIIHNHKMIRVTKEVYECELDEETLQEYYNLGGWTLRQREDREASHNLDGWMEEARGCIQEEE